EAVKGMQLQEVREVAELDDAALDVALQQQVEDFAGGVAVLPEQGWHFLARLLGTLATGEQGRVPRQMAQKVERIGVGLATCRGELVEADLPLGQFLQHRGA